MGIGVLVEVGVADGAHAGTSTQLVVTQFKPELAGLHVLVICF